MIALMLHLGYKPMLAIPVGLVGDLIIAKIIVNALGG